jgi:hypothetical protein
MSVTVRRPGEPAIQYKFGPYYQSAVRNALPQWQAIGKPPISEQQMAGLTAGEMEARYEGEKERAMENEARKRTALAERQVELSEKEASGSTTKAITGGLTGAMSGAAMGAMAGSVIPGLGTAAGAIIGGVIGLAGGGLSGAK